MDGEPSRTGGFSRTDGQRSDERWDEGADSGPRDEGRRRAAPPRKKPALPALSAGAQRTGAHAAPAGTRGVPGVLALGNWPVAARLFAVIVLAAAMGLVFGGLQVSAAISQSNQFTQVTQLAHLGQQVTTFAQALEDERDQTAGALAIAETTPGMVFNTSSVQPYYNATDRTAASVIASASAIGDSFPATIQSRAASVLAIARNLSGLRGESQAASIEGLSGPVVAVTEYTDQIAALFALDDVIAQGNNDSTLTDEVQTLGALSRAKDQASQQRALLYGALLIKYRTPGAAAETEFGAGGFAALETSNAEQQDYLVAFTTSATVAEEEDLRSSAFNRSPTEAQLIENYILQQGTPDFSDLGIPTTRSQPDEWYYAISAEINGMRSVESRLTAAIVDQSGADQRNVERSAWETALVTGSILLLVLLAALLVARSLVLPLRRLRASALEIASVSLPERVRALSESADPDPSLEVTPVSVRSTDEVGQVARAFDLVHQEAVRLAGNEAVLRGSLNAMFVSLSRRSQSLIERLSRMIDSLELNEDDPERLSNLFSMDHLVTRMRRNSENLLVLAGHEGGRKRTEPVLLGDVVRAATSEIEQYGRVVLSIQAGIEVSGQAATDVIHLLAEIIENATIFSPRSTEVHVMGQEIHSGGVLIEVSDSGVGISETRLEQLNWRLEHPPVVDVSVSRHMGLFAVSHLAARHGVRVRLRASSPRGLIAMVWLPDTVAGPARTSYGERLRRLGAAGGAARLAATSTETAAATMPPLVAAGVPSQGAGSRQYGSGESPQLPRSPRSPRSPQYADAQSAGPRQANWFRGRPGQAGQDTTRQPAPGTPGGQQRVPPGGPPQNPWEVPGWKFFQEAPEPVDGGTTTAGLPVRVPQANRIPSGQQPQSRPVPSYDAQASQAVPAGEPSPLGAPGQGPAPRRSPETARNRLGGFQRGARRAEGHSLRPGEGTDR